MKIERAILIAFLGNYLINTVVTGLASLIPSTGAGGLLTPQYITFVLVAALVVLLFTWWYRAYDLKGGVIFGVTGVLVAVLTALVSGLSGVMAQTGSITAAFGVLPNFWPFLANWSTLVLACYWIIPAAIYGQFFATKRMPAMKPTIGSVTM